MDIWETLCARAREQYHPQQVSPFLYAHHVVLWKAKTARSLPASALRAAPAC